MRILFRREEEKITRELWRLDEIDRALKLEPNDAFALFFRGLQHGRQGNDDQALVDLQLSALLGCKEAEDALKSLDKQ